MNHELFQEHRLRLVLFFVGWLSALGVSGQTAPRELFPLMPEHSTFQPQIIEGQLPETSGLRATNSRVSIGRQPLRRGAKAYWEIDAYYDNEVSAAFYLRQQGDTVWLAMDAWDENWNAEQAAQKLPSFQQHIQQLQAEYADQMAPPPLSLEENVFLRFNAPVGEQWTCFSASHGGLSFYWVQLDKIIPQKKSEALYVFSVLQSNRASHMPQLMKLVVSKTKGIRGMLWYDYACWETPRYDCEDLLVRYGNWE